MCLVIGAAGWGKTGAVSAWAEGTRMAWVRCGGTRHGLLAEIYLALRPHLPVPPPDRDPAAAPGSAPADEAAGELCSWLGTHLHEDLVLVFEDLHELAVDSADATLVDRLCRGAPGRLHLVLISRRDPPFSLDRLRGQGFVTEVSAAQLALDAADVTARLRDVVGGADPADVAELVVERTGGWPVAVDAAVAALRGSRPDQHAEVLDGLTRPGERLHDFLAAEVVRPESPANRDLLLRLAVCGEVGSVTGPEDAAGLVDLTRRGLVRRGAPGRAGPGGWSLLAPLRDYLRHDSVLPAHDRAALHRSTAKECLVRGAPGEALRHLVAAGEWAESAEVLREHGRGLVRGGQVAAVLEAAELPEEYLDDADLQGVLGEAWQASGHPEAARRCFRRAGRGDARLAPSLAWRMAEDAFMRGELREVRWLHGRTRTDPEDGPDGGRMLVLVALAWRMTGDLISFRDAVTRAVAVARHCADPGLWSQVHVALAVQAGAEADHRRAEAEWVNARDRAAEANDLMADAMIGTLRAGHLLAFGMPRRALAEAEAAIEVGRRCGNPTQTAHAMIVRGRSRTRLGMLDAAVDDLTAAVTVLQAAGSRLLAWPLCGLGDVHRLRAQPARARAAYQEARSLAEPGHEVFGLGMAMTGLARVLGDTDPAEARELAERAVALREPLLEVPAVLARGWVALRGGDRGSAATDAARAGTVAGRHRDEPGLAEALLLGALSGNRPVADVALFGQAVDIWGEAGCVLEESAARVLAARAGAQLPHLDVERAERALAERGVGPGAVLGPVRLPGPSVMIRTLGALSVTRDGLPVPSSAWKSKKARDLIRLLVARRRPVPREQLIEFLWPGANAARSGNRLSVLLTMVRDVLQPERKGDGPLAADGACVWLDRQNVGLDVEDFLDRARRALDAHARDAGDALDLVIAAESGYTGGFLEDDPYQEWAQSLAEDVRATHIALLRALVARLRRAGDVDRVVRYLLRLLDHDAFDERAHLDLIGMHVDAGHYGEARRRYRLYTARMKEMGVAPRPMPGGMRGGSTR